MTDDSSLAADRAAPAAALEEIWPDRARIDDAAAANATAQRGHGDGSPWVSMVMISSLDGAAEINGLSGGLGAPADKAVFGAMRAMADVIVVAGGTARAENYGPAVRRDAVAAARRARGQAEVPRIAVLSNSLSFDPEARLFERRDDPPLLYSTAGNMSATAQKAALADRAEVVMLDQVSPQTVISDLGRRGTKIVVLEGGPSLNGQFLAAGLVDEINLSVAPIAVGGDAMRITRGPELPDPALFDLARIWQGDGILFLRYVRRIV